LANYIYNYNTALSIFQIKSDFFSNFEKEGKKLPMEKGEKGTCKKNFLLPGIKVKRLTKENAEIEKQGG
jgi:hypothetical protein